MMVAAEHHYFPQLRNITNTFLRLYSNMKKAITYAVAAIAVVGAAVLLFSLIGVGVFFLPLLAGAFK